MKLTKKQIRANRLWNHFKSYISYPIFNSSGHKVDNYDPEPWRDAFMRYQSLGRKALTEEEREGIKPLIDAQANKEIFINSLVLETLEFDAKGWGFIHPINSTLDTGVDRLTKRALLKIKRNLLGKFRKDGKLQKEKDYDMGFFWRLNNFYKRHPVSEKEESQFLKLIAVAIARIGDCE